MGFISLRPDPDMRLATCTICGFVAIDQERPDECPLCDLRGRVRVLEPRKHTAMDVANHYESIDQPKGGTDDG